MIALASIRFVKPPFCIHHLLICKTGVAITMIDKDTLIGLIWIRSILNGLSKSTVAVQNFCNRHFYFENSYISS